MNVVRLTLTAALAVTLTGCSALSNLTNPDGTAINPGPVCVDTANGRFCYMPTPVPGTAAVAPAPVLNTPTPQLAK